MFRIAASLAVILSVSTPALADGPTPLPLPLPGPLFPIEFPLIQKTNSPGFTLLHLLRSETCQLFKNRVVITRTFANEYTITETRQVKVTGDVAGLGVTAGTEAVTASQNFICDLPSTEIRAGATVLYTSGGCGEMKQEVLGESAKILRDMIDTYCPVTH